MMGRALWAGVLVLAWLLPYGAQAAGRVALVIGNGAYQHTARLANPSNDAADVAAALRGAGFAVATVTDAGKAAMEKALSEFAGKAADSDMAVLFYAGHGMELGGQNYLIPVDARLQTEATAAFQAIRLGDVMDIVGASRLGIVFLDACRDNPLVNTMSRRSGTRSAFRGLARIEPLDNLQVVYAARDGSRAADGEGRNSPFTTALLQGLKQPGLDIRDLWGEIRSEVLRLTGRQQEPYVYGPPLSGRHYFIPPREGGTPAAAPSVPAPDPELLAFQAAQRVGSEAGWKSFLQSYPGSAYAATANIELAALTRPRPQPSAPAPVSSSPPAASSGSGPFRDCADCPEMVWVPAGRFEMGSPSHEADRANDEGPVHEVRIDYALAVGRYEVTRGQWRQFLSESGKSYPGGCNVWDTGQNKWVLQQDKSWRDAGYAQDDSHPVVCVAWQWAKDYAAWLSARTGKKYRLLSEAEFEYVNRAGGQKAYPWGSSSEGQCRYANGADTQAKAKNPGWTVASCNDGYAETAPAGKYSPNAFGLYDVSGNVWEWTEDCWNEGYVGAPTNGAVWAAGDCARRVVRGGSWSILPAFLRAALRGWTSAAAAGSNQGFRLARTE